MTSLQSTAPAPDASAECSSHPAVGASEPGLAISEVAAATGVGVHTLRYYERIGLLRVPRDASGRRTYGPTDVGRVVMIGILRAAGMPIGDLQTYFGLVQDGPGNEPERLAVLERHRDSVVASIDELRGALELIELKIARYRDAAEL